MRDSTKILASGLVLLWCTAGCSSSAAGPDSGSPDLGAVTDSVGVADVGTDLAPPTDDAGSDAGLESEYLSCPTPGALPFETPSHAFANEATQTLIDDNPFRLGTNHDFVGQVDEEQVILGSFVRGQTGLTPFAVVPSEADCAGPEWLLARLPRPDRRTDPMRACGGSGIDLDSFV